MAFSLAVGLSHGLKHCRSVRYAGQACRARADHIPRRNRQCVLWDRPSELCDKQVLPDSEAQCTTQKLVAVRK